MIGYFKNEICENENKLINNENNSGNDTVDFGDPYNGLEIEDVIHLDDK